MNGSDEHGRETDALRERISTLSAAVLRISASLDVGTVLRETVDSARALTGARYGVITTIDDAGKPQDFFTSGLSAGEQQQMMEWPHAMRFFEHLRDLAGPLRVPDLQGYLRSLGYTPVLVLSKTLQATPMHHRGVHVGDFFLAEKEGGQEFTADDEEVLVLFASQAANAIANARTHEAEQRARADLEALVETSPVGVAVFDAATGHPVSLNREARRLAGRLSTTGSPLEELLEGLTCRFSDGREIALAEFPMKRVISGAATVRAEEVVLSVPDGRRITLLVNATPIHSADGTAVSMVVTLQDLAPLEELERLRADFLGMVSHELRAPLTSIKGATTTVLRAARVLDPAEVRQFFRIIDAQADHMDGLIGDLLDAGRIDSGTLSVDPEPMEVAALVDRARTTFMSGGGRQSVRIDLPPDLPRVMADERRIVQVLNNLSPTRPGTLPSRPRLTSARCATAFTSRFPCPTKDGACRRNSFRTCSASTPTSAGAGRPTSAASAWAWPSARGWWKRTGAASGPRAPGSAEARRSRSRSRWPTSPRTAPRQPCLVAGRAGPGTDASRHASSWWTTTRRCCATCGTRSPRRATRRS